VKKTIGYVVKQEDFYADGHRGWIEEREKAFVFPDRNWAKLHATSFNPAGRVVRLVRK
jgi:hypothetical protein